MFTKCLDWYEKQDEADSSSLMLLRKIKYLSMKKARDSYKQTEIIFSNNHIKSSNTQNTLIR